ncbi:hypothetical protein F5X71_20630 [Nocardia brasiliensis]|uniref:Uncharacterized protein n=1 Tax=Nocardia brasiliensis TaxID=37326 RepID=A0A6G9XTX6_NOCBR|nr:hypothetical protein [Nocardia brasiliensis]QIS04412.1 hypothetical protein F5X71_20630 [Nocardia brasiliensis]
MCDDQPVTDVPRPLAPGADTVVVGSPRIPLDMDQSIEAEARSHGVT